MRRLLAIMPALLFASCDLRIGTALTSRIDVPSEGRSASRTSGVAPLAVAFYAGGSPGSETDPAFHHYEYAWDFDDPSSGTWGTTGGSKNAAKGPVAAHVFESPGSYRIKLTIRDGEGIADADTFIVSVDDPDIVYAGESTTCVSSSGNFEGAPPDSRRITTADLSTITRYAAAGSRVLLRRGDSWTVSASPTWPENAGPVTIGAFGTETARDPVTGICANAPLIAVAAGADSYFLAMDGKQDWRIMDLRLVDPSRTSGTFGGAMEMRRQLFLRLKVEGFSSGIGWSHWNGSRPMAVDQMAVVCCDVSDSDVNVLYIGGERLALLGTVARNARTSHVVRVWQAYKSVIGENLISGSSLDTATGRHALKLHGPGYSTLYGADEYGEPVEGTGLLKNRTRYCVVSSNVFGSSGPWPVCIGPQDALTDSFLSDIVFERNRIISQYGDSSSVLTSSALRVGASGVTLRNNVFDGTGANPGDYCAITVARCGSEPYPSGVEICNNTIYRSDNSSGNNRVGFAIGAGATSIIVMNNIVSFPFPGPGVDARMLDDSSSGGTAWVSNTWATEDIGFLGPDGADPLARDFSLAPGSAAIGWGAAAPVFEDILGRARPERRPDRGAYQGP